MEIIAVYPWWQLVGDDEDESEAVVLRCMEFVLAETNAYYAQKRLAQKLVQYVSTQVVHDVMDVVYAATMQGEERMEKHAFHLERMPPKTWTDRHAVHRVPSRHAVPRTVPFPAVREETDKVRSGMRRTKRVVATNAFEVVERDELHAMTAESVAWREKCLASLQKATQKTDFAKWAALARAFTVPATRLAMDVGVINEPLPHVVDAMAAIPVSMKTNVETFSAIVDLSEPGRRSSLTTLRRASRPVSSPFHSVTFNSKLEVAQSVRVPVHRMSGPFHALEYPRSTRLTDSLSGRASIRKSSSIQDVTDGEVESKSSRGGAATETDTQACAFPATIKVAAGVILAQGETVIHGPKRVDGPATMSRTRFILQQRLALDTLVHASSVDSLPLKKEAMPLCVSEKGWRDDEQGATALFPSPQLSPIVPRTHLKTALSTPLLRVRSPVANVKGGHLRRSWMTSGDTDGCTSVDPPKLRPRTALKAMPLTASTMNGTAPAKYLREFPKPQAGVVHVVSNQAAVLLSMQKRPSNAWPS